MERTRAPPTPTVWDWLRGPGRAHVVRAQSVGSSQILARSPLSPDLAREAAALPGALASAYPALLADYLGCVFPDGDGAAVVQPW
jgi:hypothetical protein